MAVRKIPLKERPAFACDGSAVLTTPEGEESEDTEVDTMLSVIRKKLLSDRALYDKVGNVLLAAYNDID